MSSTKRIIQRNLSLLQKYALIQTSYISLIDGGGCACDNCGKLISNIATIKGEDNKTYYVGFDCLETFLINNQLLSGADIEQYQNAKKSLPKINAIIKEVKDTINRPNNYDQIEVYMQYDRWVNIDYVWLNKSFNGHKYARRCNNTSVKISDKFVFDIEGLKAAILRIKTDVPIIFRLES